jgi:ferredoxin-NADP reductase
MTSRFDTALGRIPMYRLVLVWLVVIHLVAFVLTFLGQLSFGPLDLLVSDVIAIGVTVAVSLVGGRIVRQPAHLESSVITGLILAIVLPPGADIAEWAVIALAAGIAGASKYLLAIRGRHLFNPAAIGATVVTATGLTFSGWWVGTALLAPVVVVGGALVLLRTRRLPMGALFVAVAVAIVVVRMMSSGSAPLDALSIAVTSYPILFLAGFMLSEPLTLPPRRWQQLVLAVIVAALLTVPWSIGPVFSTPQLALVIGNLLAFLVGQRRGVRLELLERRQLTPRSWELEFQPFRSLRFTPGQYLELALPHRGADQRGTRRTFSISSAPGADRPITIGIRTSERSSTFKSALLELEPGDTVRATLVAGDFTLPAVGVPVLLVAGGIGITPFASQLADAHERGLDRDAVVVYTVGDVAELAYSELLERSGVRVIVVAPTAPDRMPPGWIYAGADRVTADLIAAHVPDLASRRAFVSGPPALVDALASALRGRTAGRVRRDAFAGY